MRLETPVRRSGFTLIEVLVVAAIIITLGALTFMAVGKITNMAHRAGSVEDIKQLSAISLAGAGDNNGVFPKAHFVTENGGAPFWFSWEWREDNKRTKDLAYSPSNECWTADGKDRCEENRDLWNFGGEEEGSSSLFSYACVIDDPVWTKDGEFVQPEQEEWQRIRDDVYNEDDDTYRWTPKRTGGQEVAYPILWVDLAVVWNDRRIGNYQEGEEFNVHVGFMDGHVEWRQGTQVRERFSRPGLTLHW
ncbi:MAG: type II secretion system protein [Verrucomicrobiota bacterium]|nr:type II secretion system protein [Verrucomicrobiota bacterium]